MKVTLTTSEIIAMVRRNYNLPLEVDVEIINDVQLPVLARNLIQIVEGYNPNEKIAKIKAFRQFYATHYPTENAPGMFNSKWVIENWNTYKKELFRLVRVPDYNEIDQMVRENRNW